MSSLYSLKGWVLATLFLFFFMEVVQMLCKLAKMKKSTTDNQIVDFLKVTPPGLEPRS